MLRLHREGRFILITVALLLIAANATLFVLTWGENSLIFSWVFLGVSIILYGFLLNFFRNPKRSFTYDPDAVIAPCDGKIVAIERVFEPIYFQKEMQQVSIFMSPLNVHVNWCPVSGKVVYSRYYAGKYLIAWHPKSSVENEHTFFVFENGKGKIACKQIAGILARRIKYYIRPSDMVRQGQELGFIKFGSRVDLLLPLDYQICVNLGSRTQGGKTIIARVPS
ncbi:MAG: phosphatidylserine decarboxylase family protein [Bacteroidia bacterium]|nr:phosphatidylserine decarboxylase family protein [Bacteroidia bacterium]MDW8159699.1 phosphatidylserine decarboxylase family protein [Bacteroidia bacterium]